MDPVSLQMLIQGGETQTVEFKASPPRLAYLAERLCGLANGLGGFLVIGVADQTWEILGLKQPQEAIDCLLQAAWLCKPLVPFMPPHPRVIEIQARQVVVAYVPPNDGTLYQAGGVCWIRRGTHTVPMDVSEIEQWLYHRGTPAWEIRPVASVRWGRNAHENINCKL